MVSAPAATAVCTSVPVPVYVPVPVCKAESFLHRKVSFHRVVTAVKLPVSPSSSHDECLDTLARLTSLRQEKEASGFFFSRISKQRGTLAEKHFFCKKCQVHDSKSIPPGQAEALRLLGLAKIAFEKASRSEDQCGGPLVRVVSPKSFVRSKAKALLLVHKEQRRSRLH